MITTDELFQLLTTKIAESAISDEYLINRELYLFVRENFSRLAATLSPSVTRALTESVRKRTESMMLSPFCYVDPDLLELCTTANEMMFTLCATYEIDMTG